MPLRFIILLITSLGLTALVTAQPQNRNWYFGYNAGMQFDTAGNPTPLTDGILTSRNNATAISDANGDLVFYSDGHRLYNKFHQQILHGDSLYTSRLQSATIGYRGSLASGGSVLLPSVDDTDVYVMFTSNLLASASSGFQAGLLYNKISVSGDSVVLPKNQMIYPAPSSDEYLSDRVLAIRHANGRDWWLITHRINLDAYWIWLYDPYGIHGPYAQQIGQFISAAGYSGWLASNKEGNKIFSVANGGYAEVLDFDRCTGQLSNWVDLGFPPYPNLSAHIGSGIFSANDQVAYIAGEEAVYQYDLTSATPKATETVIYSNPYYSSALPVDSQLKLGFWKLGLEDKLYISLCPSGNIDNQPSSYQFNPRAKYLAVIHNPDVLGSGCNFQLDGFYLDGKYSTYAIPNTAYHIGALISSGCDTIVPQSLPTALFTSDQTTLCEGSCVQFTNQSTGAASYQWFFPFGTPTSSLDSNPTPVCYAQDGSFPVTLVVTNPDGSDTLTVENYITVHQDVTSIIMYPANDTFFTVGQFEQYQWFKDSILIGTDSFCVLVGDGLYSVIVTNENGCTGQANYLVTKATETAQPLAVTVSPNPASQKAHCSWSNVAVTTVELYDALGKKLETLFPHSNSIELDLQQLPNGVYMIRAIDKNGFGATRRLVVE